MPTAQKHIPPRGYVTIAQLHAAMSPQVSKKYLYAVASKIGTVRLNGRVYIPIANLEKALGKEAAERVAAITPLPEAPRKKRVVEGRFASLRGRILGNRDTES